MPTAVNTAIGSNSSLNNFHRTLPGRIILSVAATGLLAICAHISVPLPFTAVPLTLQTFAVILIGLVLGPVTAFSAVMLYLAEGAAGLPVFSPHGPGGIAQLLGPTAGYLFSYPLAAALAGAVVRISTKQRTRFLLAVIAGAIASLPVFLLGAGWLAHLLHLDPAAAWNLAVAPFLPGEVVKVLAAAGIYTSLARSRSH
jgi:biotin transport system substrate-specific component